MSGPLTEQQKAFQEDTEAWKKLGFVGEQVSIIDADLNMLKAVFQEYYRTFGEFPTGDSDAILGTMRGENRQQLAFLGSKGEILDPWKTPYHFSREGNIPIVEVRSAGPDKALWSNDDMVSKVEVPKR